MTHFNMYLGYVGALLLLSVLSNGAISDIEKCIKEYYVNRTQLIIEEGQLWVGGKVQLNYTEQKANEIFRKIKMADLKYEDIAGMHFYDVKDIIQNSSLYKLIRKMPKGANLNIHALGSVSSDWFVKNLTYMEGFRTCKDAKNRTVFTFRIPQKANLTKCKFAKVQRYKKGNSTYDKRLKTLVDLHSIRDPQQILPNDKMWNLFCDMYDRVEDAVYYEPAFRAFHRQMLEEMYEDNIMYAEVRTQFYKLYDNTGKVYKREDTVRTLKEIVNNFTKDHKDFIGVKFIFAVVRHGSEKKLRNKIKQYVKLRAQFPNDIIGLDLVGWEDIGQPLHKFIKEFIEFPTEHANFFFHAGETNLLGDASDYNLFDAFLLLSKRIGMGYALWKHPNILKEIISWNIPIEICPVSNQITSFVRDLRNHPGGYFMAKNVTVVIGSDSPGFFGTTGLSTDFYYTILSLTSSKADLKTLKKLVLNSINYSEMEENERGMALKIFYEKWEMFVKNILEDHKKRNQTKNKLTNSRNNWSE